MTVCRLMCMDFMDGTGRYGDYYDGIFGNEMYSDMDLEEGAAYARWLLDDGYVVEPFYKFDLAEFENWCKNKLKPKKRRSSAV